MNLLRKIPKKIIVKLLHYYPPYWGTGVRIDAPHGDMTEFKVTMPLTAMNKNYVGVHFGGSLYAMCDPFFMLIAMEKLGENYLVWDKSASIDFKRPGRGTVYAHFFIDDKSLEEVKETVELEGKCEPVFKVDVKNDQEEIIATVSKTLWVKRKRP